MAPPRWSRSHPNHCLKKPYTGGAAPDRTLARRNHFSDPCLPKCAGYYGMAAQLMTADRRARQRKLIRHPELCKRVISRIKAGWTPEQIAHRMIHERARPRVCQETIYRYVYAEEGMREELWRHLPTTARHADRDEPGSGRRRSFTVTSASCSGRTKWRTGNISGTGKLT
jgi:IS30 family transposase